MKFIYRFEFTGKTSTLPKHGDVILNSMSQTGEKRDSLVSSRVDF